MNQSLTFICPECKKPLDNLEDKLSCSHCDVQYPVREGVPSFAKSNFYWNEIPQDEMQTVIETAKTDGWQTAVYDVLDPEGSEVHATVGDERRADWKFLLPLSKESRVLDLGCGWGAASIALSQISGQVVSMDATWERVQFLNIRKQQQHIDNLFPIHGGDTLTYPFPNEYFDFIVLVGVLEWLGESYPDLPPREAQTKALRNLRSLLKPNGHIYIAIENRLGYDYLTGRPDHNGLPYVGLMPRKMADWVSRRRTGEPFRTYQYAMSGYKKLLSECGFEQMEFYGDLPQYRHPHFYIPLQKNKLFNYFLTHLWKSFTQNTPDRANEYRWAYQLANKGVRVAQSMHLSGFARYITPGFSIIAQRS